MKRDLENRLGKRYVFMRKIDSRTGERLEESILCDCGDGWYDLIVDLCYEIQEYCQLNKVDMATLKVLQVKEKYGELRFHLESIPEGLYEITKKYEKLSKDVCEMCGGLGKSRGRTWIEKL